jgi:transcriptional regulator with XRE-family HTH domain
MIEISEFATLLAQYRTERNFSQGQLAKAARLSRTYVYHLEHGLRQQPSSRAVRAIIRALQLHGDERRNLLQAFTHLTGHYLEEEHDDATFLDLSRLSSLLVENTILPAHSMDRLWRVRSWNKACFQLFEATEDLLEEHMHQLLHLVFDPLYRRRFQPWEELARRLISDFKYQARGLAFMPEYRELLRTLKRLPDYKRLNDTSDAVRIPTPSFVFQMKHTQLGTLSLRTAISVFTSNPEFSIVVYLPGNEQTLALFRECGWQQEP